MWGLRDPRNHIVLIFSTYDFVTLSFASSFPKCEPQCNEEVTRSAEGVLATRQYSQPFESRGRYHLGGPNGDLGDGVRKALTRTDQDVEVLLIEHLTAHLGEDGWVVRGTGSQDVVDVARHPFGFQADSIIVVVAEPDAVVAGELVASTLEVRHGQLAVNPANDAWEVGNSHPGRCTCQGQRERQRLLCGGCARTWPGRRC